MDAVISYLNMSSAEFTGGGIDTDSLFSVAEFGHGEVKMIPMASIIDLRQVRHDIDREALQVLKDRIPYSIDVGTGRIQFDVIHPVMVAELNLRQLERYIWDHDEYYGASSEVNMAELPNIDGLYYVRVAGHMRGLAERELCADLGIDQEQSWVRASVEPGLNFMDGNRLQNLENTRVPVSPEDDARSIERHRDYLLRHGLDYTYRSIGEYFGYSEDKVHSALRFVSAPQEIRDFVGAGLTYSHVVQLVRLREIYRDKLTESEIVAARERGLTPDELSDEKFLAFFRARLRNRLTGAKSSYVSGVIRGAISELNESASYQTGELFAYDEVSARLRESQSVSQEIIDLSLQTLDYSLHNTSLTPAQLAKLSQVAQMAGLIGSSTMLLSSTAD